MTSYALVSLKILKNRNKFSKIIKFGIHASDIYIFDLMKTNYITMYKFHEKLY